MSLCNAPVKHPKRSAHTDGSGMGHLGTITASTVSSTGWGLCIAVDTCLRLSIGWVPAIYLVQKRYCNDQCPPQIVGRDVALLRLLVRCIVCSLSRVVSPSIRQPVGGYRGLGGQWP